jgi:hypothetical protein
MASTRLVETVLCSQDLPLEFRHRSSAHEGEERKVASRLSGVVAARQPDEVICPYLLRRNLLVPAHLGPAALGPCHVR